MSLDFFYLVPDPFSLLLYVLCLLIVHGLVLFLLISVTLLLLEEVLDLSKFSAVDDALLDVPLFLLNLEFFK